MEIGRSQSGKIGRHQSGHTKSKSARLGSISLVKSDEDALGSISEDSFELTLPTSVETSKRGHKKTGSTYRNLLTRLRGHQKTFSVLVVGDESACPVPLLSALLDPAFRLRWESTAGKMGVFFFFFFFFLGFLTFFLVTEGMWEYSNSSKNLKITLQFIGMTFDPNNAYESVRSMLLSEARKCDVILLAFSLVHPVSLQRAVRTYQIITASPFSAASSSNIGPSSSSSSPSVQSVSAVSPSGDSVGSGSDGEGFPGPSTSTASSASSSSSRSPPLTFLVGTLRELRDATTLGTSWTQKDAYLELVRHYVNQGLLSTEDAKQWANGTLRLVTETKVREAMLAVNATSYAEVSFLPEVGNVSSIFAAMAEKVSSLRSKRPKSATHRRSRSSASSKTATQVESDDDSGGDELAGLASAKFPDSYTMESDASTVSEWLSTGLPHIVKPATPRDGLSRSAYRALLMSSASAKDNVETAPKDGFHRKEWPSGDVYLGNWSNSMYNGQGTLTLATGCSYTGDFKNGLFHGQGVFISNDKSSYRGMWNEGKRNGKGEQRYADGSSYVGLWKDDTRDVEGVLSYANGTIYAGGFKDDLFHGKGRYTFNTGSTYEGEWVHGKKTGQGILHRYDGTLRKLTYQDDVLLAQENITGPKKERRMPSLQSSLSSSAFNLMTALTLDELKIDEHKVLGEGFYGIVYRGVYRNVDVAVKRLRPNIPDNVLAKFLSEVSILAGLKNDYIVRYLGAVFEEHNLCIVTEFYGGGTLWEKIHDPTAAFTIAFVHKICFEIASAMRYLHFECQPAIIHRDLKSPNVLLTVDLQVKLADFGLARHLQSSQEMTKGIGTVSWTAPEILRSQSYSMSADVFSFAVIVWELFARKPPYHPMERDQILLAVAVNKIRPEMPADVPVVWRSLIENCWHEDPGERPDFNEIREWFVRTK